MTPKDLERLKNIERRIHELANQWGLITTEIDFEIVTANRMLESMAYNFPTNYSHWSHGRDYELHRTIYEHSGGGIPYETVWNFERPRAFLVETNPLALNATILGHVYGHVDFFLGNRFLQQGRKVADIAEEAHYAEIRFSEYARKYGNAIEELITSAMTIQWHQDPDPFAEDIDEEVVRERIIEHERARLYRQRGEFSNLPTPEEIEKIEDRLRFLTTKTPPEPTYDILGYIIKHSPLPLKPWMKDVMTVVRNQARHLAVQRRTKILNEGWATYWHMRFMRQLHADGLITNEEHGTYNVFNGRVLQKSPERLNPYNLGSALFEYIKETWDAGRFGPEYENCTDPYVKAKWDTKAGKGNEKIFQVRSAFSDRMAVETLFSDEFIKQQKIYIYSRLKAKISGDTLTVITEDDPKQIRALLKNVMTHYGIPQITVENGNYGNNYHLYLRHRNTGYELDPDWRDRTLQHIRVLWGRNVFLEAVEEDKLKLFMVNKDLKISSKNIT